MNWGMRQLALLIFTAAAAVAVADDSAPQLNAEGPVTFAEHVAPILYENCLECHRQGRIGPMAFDTYQDVRPWAKSIRKVVTERTMPPWAADAETSPHFLNNARLSDEEVATISQWVEQGARQGDPSKMPEPPVFEDEQWRIGAPDRIFTMPPFEVSDDVQDYYHHVRIEANFPEDRWLSATEIHPGDYSVVHHVLVFAIPAGGDPNQHENLDLVAAYGPGTPPFEYPEGYGKIIPAGHDLAFQVHYHKTPGPGTSTTDQSELGVIFQDKESVEHPVTLAWILNPDIQLAAGDPEYVMQSQFRFIDSGKILSLTPHMHLRGTGAKFVAEYPDGTEEVLLNVPHYDFNWQIHYDFKEPKAVPRGTVVRFYAIYDNSANNPANPDPTKDIRWGEASTDEMMIGYMSYIYDRKKQFQRTLGLPEGILADDLGRFFDDDDEHEHEAQADKGEKTAQSAAPEEPVG